MPAALILGCATPELPLPKGTSKGSHSIRLKEKSSYQSTPSKYQPGQRRVREAISSQLRSKGLQITSENPELVVAHLVIIQEDATTTALGEYFGSGLETEAIADLAHRRGVVDKKQPEYFQRAGLVIDILDAKTDELIFRNYVIRDILPEGTPDEVRQRLVSEAVQEVLAPFFR